MHGLTNGQVANHGFLRSTLVLSGCVLVVALLLLPFAMRQTGTGAPLGLAAAAGICLAAACVAEAVSCTFAKSGAHLVGMGLSMGIRLLPPLAVCVVLAATGASGRQHLPFVCYLLAFYLVALAAETVLAVKRASGKFSDGDRNSR
jgi:hypothetical protein